MPRAILAMVCGGLLCPAAAMGEEPRRFELEYQGAASCPTENELLAEVRRRAPAAVHVTSGLHVVSARLSIAADGAQQRGTIDIESRDGTAHREIQALECSEVLHALALILAIAIDPDAASPAAPELAEAPKPVRSPASSARESIALPSAPLWWAAGMSLGLAGGVAPIRSFSQMVFAELGERRDAGFSAHVRLSGVHAHASVGARAGTADFDLLALRLATCPYRLGARIALSGCASFDLGRLQARGSHTHEGRSASAYWLGPGGFIDAEFRALSWLRLQVEVGALSPLARDRFYFGPDETVHRIPALAGYGGLNVLVGG